MDFRNKAWLHQKYVVEDKGIIEIANICQCGLSTVARWLRHFNIPVKGYNNKLHGMKRENNPNWKGGQYVSEGGAIKVPIPQSHPMRKTGHRYIFLHRMVMEQHLGRYLESDERVAFRDSNKNNVHIDNLELRVVKVNGNKIIDKSTVEFKDFIIDFKDEFISKEGYKKVLRPKNYPSNQRYIFLHILLLEQKLSRYLTKCEEVHHKDRNKLNNDINNLELQDNHSIHMKEHVKDQVKYLKLWVDGWLKREYADKERAMIDIAKEVGCSEGTVRNAIKTLGIPRRKYTMTDLARSKRVKGGNKRTEQMKEVSAWEQRKKNDEIIYFQDSK